VDELFSFLQQPQATAVMLSHGTLSMNVPFPPSTGQHCTEDVDECRLQPNTCQNGGTCSNVIGSYVCVCVNGWSGPDCSENIDDCATAACSPGSTCIDRVASFICVCPYGKTGELIVRYHKDISISNVKENDCK